MIFCGMFFTSRRSSTDLNGPCSLRYATMAWARAGPTPFSSRASVLASAVLMSTGPLHAAPETSADRMRPEETRIEEEIRMRASLAFTSTRRRPPRPED